MKSRAPTPQARQPVAVEAFTHGEAKRRNIPTAEMQAVVDDATEAPVQAAYKRRRARRLRRRA